MKRVLVTGADGFTGHYLVPLLAERNWSVTALARSVPPSNIRHPNVEWVSVDLTDAGAIGRVIAAASPQAVVHLAGISSPAHGDQESIYRVNLSGTSKMLDALAGLPACPEMVILASSANVYAPDNAGRIDEESPVGPVNHYGLSKLAMEFLRGIYGTALPITIVRPFNYTGREQSRNFVIPKIVGAFADGVDRIELGNIDVSRDWSDVRTVVDAYERLLHSESAVGKTFNVCSGRAVSLRDIIDTAASIAGRNVEIGFNPAFARRNEIPSLWGSFDRLADVIGDYSPVPIEDTLRWMLQGD